MTTLIPLSNLVSVMRNGTTAEQNQEGRGLPVSRIETIADGTINPLKVRYVEFSDADVNRWRLMTGDILLSHINSIEHIGKSAIYKGYPNVLIHGMNLLLIRADTSRVIPEYLHFGLRSAGVRAHIRAQCKRAVNQASINQKELGAIELPVPLLSEQRRLVDILSRAEGIVRLRREAQKKAAELIPALFLDMFGDPATNPKGWQVKKLGELAAKEKYAIKAGPFGSALKKEFYVPCGYKIYGQEQVIRDNLDYGDYYISEEKYRELENCRVQAHDLLISLVGTFGKISIVPDKFEAGIINPRLMKITLDRSRVLPVFLKVLLTSKSMRERIESVSHGGTMSIVNVGIMKELDIVVPPLDMQATFEDHYQDAVSIRGQQTTATQKAEATFDALLARTFGGL